MARKKGGGVWDGTEGEQKREPVRSRRCDIAHSDKQNLETG